MLRLAAAAGARPTWTASRGLRQGIARWTSFAAGLRLPFLIARHLDRNQNQETPWFVSGTVQVGRLVAAHGQSYDRRSALLHGGAATATTSTSLEAV
jgi:hypothetical protein